jgi:hypothetical protein
LVAQRLPDDLGFEQERAAFQRLLPELLRTHRGSGLPSSMDACELGRISVV